MFAGNFPPVGWEFCMGQQLSIAENEVLFQLIGTTYGGDGEQTFNLPNLSSRVPIHMGTGPSGITYQLSEMAGTEQETLTIQQIPVHTHPFTVNSAGGTATNPDGNVLGASASSVKPYIQDTPDVTLNAAAISPAGGSQPHENCQPFLCINFIISLYGVFPSPT